MKRFREGLVFKAHILLYHSTLGLRVIKKVEPPAPPFSGESSDTGAAAPAGRVMVYRGTSPIRKRTPLGPYRRTIPRALWGSWGGGRFLMGEVPLYTLNQLLQTPSEVRSLNTEHLSLNTEPAPATRP